MIIMKLLIFIYSMHFGFANAADTPLTPAQIIKVPRAKSVDIGSDVKFYCQATGSPMPMLYWEFKGKEIDGNDRRIIVTDNGISVLTIHAVNDKDDGHYCCIADNDYFAVDSYCEKLTILKFPTITVHPVDTSVLLGTRAILVCRAKGAPQPDIQWMFNEEFIPCSVKRPCRYKQITEKGSLLIKQVRKKDTGSYKCLAKNSRGVAVSLSATLKASSSSPKRDKFSFEYEKEIFANKNIPKTKPTSSSSIDGNSIVPTASANRTTDIDWLMFDSTHHGIANDVVGLSPAFILGISFGSILFLIVLILVLIYRRFMPCFSYCRIDPASGLPEELRELWYPRNSLRIVAEMGRGQCGIVYEASAPNLVTRGKSTRVAVKMLQESCTTEDYTNEARLLSSFKHENIVQLLGVCCDKGDNIVRCLLFEHMNGGDLCDFLRRNGPNSKVFTKSDSNYETLKYTLTNDILLRMSQNICKGMEYLSNHNFVHRDLATRNCLLSLPDLTVKVSDFGLSRQTYNSDYYTTKKEEVVPIRWMSPEAIMYAKYSSMSDVWAFGVTIWEVYSFAKQPYYGMTNEEVILCVCQGGVPAVPDGAPVQMYGVMRLCWEFDPHKRPTFKQLNTTLMKLS